MSGHVEAEESIAFVAQKPWIQHMSLRDNVLFGEAYDPARYQVRECVSRSLSVRNVSGCLTFGSLRHTAIVTS
jgi:ATP-binding cassette subfamily C (CFTR/MRP) protein 1